MKSTKTSNEYFKMKGVAVKCGQTCLLPNNKITSSMQSEIEIRFPSSAGFEPARGIPNGFQVHRLNHSATTTFKCWTIRTRNEDKTLTWLLYNMQLDDVTGAYFDISSKESGAVEACWAHNPQVRGSKPGSASIMFFPLKTSFTNCLHQFKGKPCIWHQAQENRHGMWECVLIWLHGCRVARVILLGNKLNSPNILTNDDLTCLSIAGIWEIIVKKR